MTDPPPPRELRDGGTWHPNVTQSVPPACQTGTYPLGNEVPWQVRTRTPETRRVLSRQLTAEGGTDRIWRWKATRAAASTFPQVAPVRSQKC